MEFLVQPVSQQSRELSTWQLLLPHTLRTGWDVRFGLISETHDFLVYNIITASPRCPEALIDFSLLSQRWLLPPTAFCRATG